MAKSDVDKILVDAREAAAKVLVPGKSILKELQ